MTTADTPVADVSVIVAHHDSADTLARTLASVAHQDAGVLETIVVDDASSPDHLEAVRRLVAGHPGARLVALPENQGPAIARNTGWDVAQGTWVAFLDSDEVWHPTKISQQLAAAAASVGPPVLVATQVAQLAPDADPDAGFHRSPPPHADTEVRTVPRRTVLLRNPFPTSSVMVRRDAAGRFTPGLRHCEDYDLWLRLLQDPRPMLKVEAPLIARFKHPFGDSGLSADMPAMMRGEVAAFGSAVRERRISVPEWLMAMAVMLVRFTRQAAIMARRTARTRAAEGRTVSMRSPHKRSRDAD